MQLAVSCASLTLVCCFFLSACIHLPRTYDETSRGNSDTPAPQTDSETLSHRPLVNINIATQAELATLPGIGDGFAARIVAHRTRHGDFRRKEHLLLVDGMGERRYRRLAAFITVEQ